MAAACLVFDNNSKVLMVANSDQLRFQLGLTYPILRTCQRMSFFSIQT